MNRQLFEKLRPIIGVFIIATIISYYAGLNLGLEELGFKVLFPGLFIFSIVLDKASSFRKQEIIWFLLFLILALIAVFYPDIDFVRFSFAFNKIIVAFMGAYIGISLCNTKFNLEDYFHIAYILSLAIIIYFEYSSGNFNPVTFYAPTASRGDFGYNANYYSYMSLFANFSIFRIHLKYKKTWSLIGLFFVPLLGLAISFTTQSRSGLIFILLINVLFWFWAYKPKITNPIHLILRKTILITITLTLAFQFYSVYNNSNIENRMSSTNKGEERGHLIETGFEVFMNFPFSGVGAGNIQKYADGFFTHNTYLEALSEHGLFVGLIIILVYVLPFFKSFKLYKSNTANPNYKLSLLFFSIFLLFNNIYVFYKASFAMMYFFLMIGNYYNLLNNKNSENAL